MHFTRISNAYIRTDIEKTYNIHRCFYLVYILINKYRSYEDYSWLTIQEVFEWYGYKCNRKKPKLYTDIIDTLKYMCNLNMIQINQDLNTLTYETGVKIKIIPENFDCSKNYTLITSEQLDTIFNAPKPLNIENVLLVFLYINSHIGCGETNDINIGAYFKSIQTMSEDLSMSKKTLSQCIDYLTSPNSNSPSLLIKKEMKEKLPNIYVLNKPGYEKEITNAIARLKKFSRQQNK